MIKVNIENVFDSLCRLSEVELAGDSWCTYSIIFNKDKDRDSFAKSEKYKIYDTSLGGCLYLTTKKVPTGKFKPIDFLLIDKNLKSRYIEKILHEVMTVDNFKGCKIYLFDGL